MESELEYRVTLRPLLDEEGGGWLAEIPELPGCMSDGETPEEALANLREAKEAWIDTAKALGRPVPEPQRGLERFSGKFTIRMPKSLHKNLANEAECEGVSLNQYVVYLLSDRHSSQSTSGVIEQAATDFYVESQTTVSKQIVRATNRDWFRRGDLASSAIPQRPVGDYMGIATREVLTRDRT